MKISENTSIQTLPINTQKYSKSNLKQCFGDWDRDKADIYINGKAVKDILLEEERNWEKTYTEAKNFIVDYRFLSNFNAEGALKFKESILSVKQKIENPEAYEQKYSEAKEIIALGSHFEFNEKSLQWLWNKYLFSQLPENTREKYKGYFEKYAHQGGFLYVLLAEIGDLERGNNIFFQGENRVIFFEVEKEHIMLKEETKSTKLYRVDNMAAFQTGNDNKSLISGTAKHTFTLSKEGNIVEAISTEIKLDNQAKTWICQEYVDKLCSQFLADYKNTDLSVAFFKLLFELQKKKLVNDPNLISQFANHLIKKHGFNSPSLGAMLGHLNKEKKKKHNEHEIKVLNLLENILTHLYLQQNTNITREDINNIRAPQTVCSIDLEFIKRISLTSNWFAFDTDDKIHGELMKDAYSRYQTNGKMYEVGLRYALTRSEKQLYNNVLNSSYPSLTKELLSSFIEIGSANDTSLQIKRQVQSIIENTIRLSFHDKQPKSQIMRNLVEFKEEANKELKIIKMVIDKTLSKTNRKLTWYQRLWVKLGFARTSEYLTKPESRTLFSRYKEKETIQNKLEFLNKCEISLSTPSKKQNYIAPYKSKKNIKPTTPSIGKTLCY